MNKSSNNCSTETNLRSALIQVQRDLALIRSPAAGLKRQRDMEVEEEEEEEEKEEEPAMETDVKIATSAKKAKSAKKRSRKVARVVEEIHESDQEMLEEEVH